METTNNSKNVIKWEKLKSHLSGEALINREDQDDFVWDPNGGEYTVKSWHNILQGQKNQQHWSLWKVTWKTECLPKIKAFISTLLKGKILTYGKKKEYKVLLDVSCVKWRKKQFNTSSWIVGRPDNVGPR